MGKDENSFEEFLELDKLKQARKEIESHMRLYGRPGLYDDWVKFQAQERVRKRQEAEEQAKARAFLMEIFQWFIVIVIVLGGCAGLIWWAWITSGR
jgi:choline dehydrogenase-like flavoprotein